MNWNFSGIPKLVEDAARSYWESTCRKQSRTPDRLEYLAVGDELQQATKSRLMYWDGAPKIIACMEAFLDALPSNMRNDLEKSLRLARRRETFRGNPPLFVQFQQSVLSLCLVTPDLPYAALRSWSSVQGGLRSATEAITRRIIKAVIFADLLGSSKMRNAIWASLGDVPMHDHDSILSIGDRLPVLAMILDRSLESIDILPNTMTDCVLTVTEEWRNICHDLSEAENKRKVKFLLQEVGHKRACERALRHNVGWKHAPLALTDLYYFTLCHSQDVDELMNVVEVT